MSVSEEVFSLIVEWLEVPGERVSLDTRIVDLEADSLGLVEVLLAIEERWELDVPDEALADWKSVGDVVRYVERETAGR